MGGGGLKNDTSCHTRGMGVQNVPKKIIATLLKAYLKLQPSVSNNSNVEWRATNGKQPNNNKQSSNQSVSDLLLSEEFFV